MPLISDIGLWALPCIYRGLARRPSHFDRQSHSTIPPNIARSRPRFGQDVRVAIWSYRSMALWMLGYPKAALADTEQAITDAPAKSVSYDFDVCLASRSLDLFVARNYTEVG